MKTVLDTTDKKHVGETIDETADVIVFKNGDEIPVSLRLHDNTVLGNSNYVIFLSEE